MVNLELDNDMIDTVYHAFGLEIARLTSLIVKREYREQSAQMVMQRDTLWNYQDRLEVLKGSKP